MQPGKEREASTDEKVSINNIVPVSIDNAETAISASATSKGNILPTAIMKVVQGNKFMQCKALFDTGSQKTFVLRDVVNKLKIKTVKNATLSVDGFNSTGIKKDYNVVNLDIHCPTEIVCIEAIVVDNMPSRLHMAGRDEIVNSLTR